jgi:hypothetical protein
MRSDQNMKLIYKPNLLAAALAGMVAFAATIAKAADRYERENDHVNPANE